MPDICHCTHANLLEYSSRSAVIYLQEHIFRTVIAAHTKKIEVEQGKQGRPNVRIRRMQ